MRGGVIGELPIDNRMQNSSSMNNLVLDSMAAYPNEPALASSRNVMDNSPNGENNTMHVAGFIHKLRVMIDDPASHYAIRWNGDAVVEIVNSFQFSHEVLPLHFKHNNLSSFIRQLNLYGFKKRSAGMIRDGDVLVMIGGDHSPEHLEFTHELFRQSQPALMGAIHRKPVDKTHTSSGSGGT